MKIEDFFDSVGGSYEEVLRRIPSNAIIKKFVMKFGEDPSYSEFEKAYLSRNAEDVFGAAHTIKGVAYNLGFKNLGDKAAELTEIFRNAEEFPNDSRIDELKQELSEAYTEVMSRIALLE